MEHKDNVIKKKKVKGMPTVSRVIDADDMLELTYDPERHATGFGHWVNGEYLSITDYTLPGGYRLIPYSPGNNLIAHKVVLFPSGIDQYGDQASLIKEIRIFIHRYVDLSDEFEVIAAHYVLFTWLYDKFNELPYLRVRGDYGCGKTRFLLIVGSLCYKPIFASGASTVSPIFHILDSFGGTLIIDEADFRFSDQTADIAKLLNNGNVRGFPILRSEQSISKEFNPKAFNVYGPKLVATRSPYTDKALESRFITEEMGRHKLRSDIPINLPSEYADEARALRNKLLLYRFHNFSKDSSPENLVDRDIEPRLAQIFGPLISTIEDRDMQQVMVSLARSYDRELRRERSMDIEAQVLEIIKKLLAEENTSPVSIKRITDSFNQLFGDEYIRRISPKWIGSIVRKKLFLHTKKSNGVFVITPSEYPALKDLYVRYGITSDTHFDPDKGDNRDIVKGIARNTA